MTQSIERRDIRNRIAHFKHPNLTTDLAPSQVTPGRHCITVWDRRYREPLGTIRHYGRGFRYTSHKTNAYLDKDTIDELMGFCQRLSVAQREVDNK